VAGEEREIRSSRDDLAGRMLMLLFTCARVALVYTSLIWTQTTQPEDQRSLQRRKDHSAMEQGGNKQGRAACTKKKKGIANSTWERKGEPGETRRNGWLTEIFDFLTHSCDFIYLISKENNHSKFKHWEKQRASGFWDRPAGVLITKSIGSASICCGLFVYSDIFLLCFFSRERFC
jgi:hypothetical protein